ncbi:MAG: hypothetical protein HZC13_02705 [Nitrospirae bacterium]|nr:hypothetical protein [Nitrospirota bacterium]
MGKKRRLLDEYQFPGVSPAIGNTGEPKGDSLFSQRGKINLSPFFFMMSPELKLMQILKSGALYFALTFGAGFVLGSIRVLWAVPRFGEKTAELMETPIMFVVIILTARWVVRNFAVPPTPSRRLAVGFVAFALLRY